MDWQLRYQRSTLGLFLNEADAGVTLIYLLLTLVRATYWIVWLQLSFCYYKTNSASVSLSNGGVNAVIADIYSVGIFSLLADIGSGAINIVPYYHVILRIVRK